MKKSKIFGIIYTSKNKETGKYYIGATKKSLKERKVDHINKSNNNSSLPFHEAIATYGIDAFEWQETDTANSNDELAQKEKAYILEYNAKNEGYNSDSGGGFKKTVYQYSLEDGSLIGSCKSLEEAGKVVNSKKQDISRACLSVNKVYRGFYWSYEFKEPFEPEIDERKKGVTQLGLDGEFIREYKSINEASEVTGYNKTSIAKVCRRERKTAGGFCWTYN
ncbi:NUMOD1 domain-containing DNA-binding protein [Lacinutrix neustonica]|uniref:NUMOD1 domain-containing DNA-binding protein n=1 Tax=Lacinutrix neustonica TaxID=2980107 RepID=A0A9E8MW29_9FLAO|nr:NUMOD1 domain-containing DNA-binding protein [Lacinutrix neustonica]WAC01677.1 NUMOD1 domain-containing DNA-binding protein [Lacinutrix neustonica]